LIREAVQSRLESLGMIAAELARLSGVHPVVLYRWLSGSRSISLANAERVLLALELEVRPEVITR
jgi:transcriptional regulator with XRE-family HTH domain